MTESFTFAQPWKGFTSLTAKQSDAIVDASAPPSTPIRSQPACFRVGTPFPLAATPGGVRVAGKNATEIGFSFPTLKENGATSFVRNNNSDKVPLRFAAKEWLHFGTGPASIGGVRDEAETPRRISSSPKGTRPSRSIVDPAASRRTSVRSERSEKGGAESDVMEDMPFRESLERLSLEEGSNGGGRPFQEKSTNLRPAALMDTGEMQSEIEKLKKEVVHYEQEVMTAREEIHGLKENLKTLEFKREEYTNDDGCLGMYEFLKSWEEKLENGIVDLKEKLQEEMIRRAAYQNRYYAEVAKNAHLEERLDGLQAQLKETLEKGSAEPNKRSAHKAPRDARAKKKAVARNGISKKGRARQLKRS